MKVITQYNYQISPGEFNKLPSKTQLDQSMSISEILRRFVIERQMPEEVAEFPQEYDYDDDRNITDDVVFNSDSFPQEYGDIAEAYVDQMLYQEEVKASAAISKAKKSKNSGANSDSSDDFTPPVGVDQALKDGIDES